MESNANAINATSTFRNVIVPGLLILLFAIAFNIFIYIQELNFFRTSYDNEVAGTKSLLNRRIQSTLIAAETTGGLFASSQKVTKDEFESFTSVLTTDIGSGSIMLPLMVEWADAQNKIQYAYPITGDSSKVIGLDLGTDPDQLPSIVKAKETKFSVVSEPLIFAEGYPGLLVYSPVFKGVNYEGTVIVAIRLADLLAPTPGSNPVYAKNVYIQTGNFIIPFDDDVIFNNNGERILGAGGGVVKDPVVQEYVASASGLSENIVFADKTWQLRLSPAYLTEVNGRVSLYAGASLLFVLMFGIFLWILQKRREQLLRETARTAALLGNIGDGLVACDKDGIVNFTNRKAEELSGYGQNEMLGKHYYDAWHLYDSKGVDILKDSENRPFRLALTEKKVTHISMASHMYVSRKDGTRLPIAATIAPIVVNEQVEGVIAVFTDITRESEVDRMKSEFLSLASHQLMTPISGIKWLAETILDGDFGPVNEKQKEYVQDVETSARRMGELVNSLLNISRIESGRLMVKPEPTLLGDLAEEVIKEVRVKSDARNQKIDLQIDPNLPKVNVDPHLVGEIYKNFLTNAIKYSPENGTISVEIRLVGNDIVSSVSDHGYGIPENQQGRVFQKFYRGENIVEKEKDGNGLGLYLVKQIVEASGGKTWFKSVLNEGTTFWFSLPLSGSIPKAGEVTIT